MSGLFDKDLARQAIDEVYSDGRDAFLGICDYLDQHPEDISLRVGKRNSSGEIAEPESPLHSLDGLRKLAQKYARGRSQLVFPSESKNVPDDMTSIILEIVYGYSKEKIEEIKIGHKYSMSAENCVGALLERYLDSKLKDSGWIWCCGDFVKATDFIHYDHSTSKWTAMQIKNRSNSENSSSAGVRKNTAIIKWFRIFATTGKTNWENLDSRMQGYGLSEEGFAEFVKSYLHNERTKLLARKSFKGQP